MAVGFRILEILVTLVKAVLEAFQGAAGLQRVDECGEDRNVETVCSRDTAMQVVAGWIGSKEGVLFGRNLCKLAET